jgi:hypothetical protein
MRRIKQEPEKMDMNAIWENEKNDHKNVRIQMSKRCNYGSYSKREKPIIIL